MAGRYPSDNFFPAALKDAGLTVPQDNDIRMSLAPRYAGAATDGRDPGVDLDAMAKALDSGHLAAVGLDVYEHEPVINESLLKNKRALLVPHLGTHTVETLAKMEAHAMENARRGVFGEELLSNYKTFN